MFTFHRGLMMNYAQTELNFILCPKKTNMTVISYYCELPYPL